MRYIKPAVLLALYSAIGVGLTLVIIFGTGMVVVYTLIATAFFISIMFPTIFSLGIAGLSRDTQMGSSLLVMSIVGGALLPPLLGLISDKTHSIQYGYFVPLVCLLVVFLFAIYIRRHQAQNPG
eukprot:TRINITY_DN104956_c0_g1_i1.p1 TRINITY_DN104956_c0_g1~~TRINITY_DN104956_c0_g1_i1.p1  ORF type:complete len:133 (+),score=2.89 TRINITY_DN104956_c0_g1_i1:29-400(+)